MAMRLSGLMSGMDTESIVNQLVEARKAKVTKTIKAQKSLGFKQEAWKSLNTQILKLYDGFLSNMRFSSSYMKKVTKVSNSSVASVITGEGAMNSVQELEVKELAKSAYLTGGKLERAVGAEDKEITGETNLWSIGLDLPGGESSTIKVTVGGEEKIISVGMSTTINDFVGQLRDAGLNANFDANNGRIYVSAKSTGKESDFEITGVGINGWKALDALGLNVAGNEFIAQKKEGAVESLKELSQELGSLLKQRLENNGISLENLTARDLDDEKTMALINKVIEAERTAQGPTSAIGTRLTAWQAELAEIQQMGEKNAAIKVDAADAVITLNGLEYTSSKNTFEINGLTITASAKGTATLTTVDDTDGIYDMIKNFFKEYNTLINQMDKLYNAESAKDYEPLTDEEKAEMSDSAVEEWEKKIKDSILRRDSSLNTIASAMKQVMLEGAEVNGKKMYLSNFGIETLSYFIAAENEKNAYHIKGDSDDPSVANEADKLKSMIASDPDTVVAFFTKLSQNLYGKMTEVMGPTEYSSAYTAYDDKKMKTEYEDYKSKIKELEKKLADYEDQWYAKFAAMETAMAKMQRNASAVTSLLGGS